MASRGPEYKRTEGRRAGGRRIMAFVADILGSALWMFFAILHLRSALESDYPCSSYALFGFYGLVAMLMLVRRPARHVASMPTQLIGWLSAALPMAGLRASAGGQGAPAFLLQGVGAVGLILAVLSLGKSFGIAPADRGLCTGGMYRFVRHPLYASELIFNLGYVWGNPSWRNAIVVLLMLGSQIVRIHYEERILEGYSAYAGRVRWRLVPGLW